MASRISRAYNRPALVVGSDGEGFLKGSGRSIEGVDLVEIFKECSQHIIQWGGHPLAIGLTIDENQLDDLRQTFNQVLQQKFPTGLPEPAVRIDAEITPADLDEALLNEIACLMPYGQGNPEPVFVMEGVKLASTSPLGTGHLRVNLDRGPYGPPLEGVAWGMADNAPPVGIPIDLVMRYHWHTWKGRRSRRITLVDWRHSA